MHKKFVWLLSVQKGKVCRMYRLRFIDKHDHVISWNKDLLSQISRLRKKDRDFSTF